MLLNSAFTDFLAQASSQAAGLEDGGVLSLALPLAPLDPLKALAALPLELRPSAGRP